MDFLVKEEICATRVPLLAALFGGALVGFGLGIIFRNGGTTGGLDIIVRLVKMKYRYIKTGAIFLLSDIIVVSISAIVFKNIDVLNVDEDDDNYRGVMSICCGDKNRVRKVLFENIRVEDCEEARLVDIRVLFNEKYNTVPGGTIENIVFRNIDYKAETGDMYPMRIKGYDEKSVVRGVFMENVVLNGTKMVSPDGIEMNAYVKNVQVK